MTIEEAMSLLVAKLEQVLIEQGKIAKASHSAAVTMPAATTDDGSVHGLAWKTPPNPHSIIGVIFAQFFHEILKDCEIHNTYTLLLTSLKPYRRPLLCGGSCCWSASAT